MFWKLEARGGAGAAGAAAAILEGADGAALSYDALRERAAAFERAWAGGKALVAILADNSAAAIAAYLGALRAGHVALLANAATDESLLRRVIETYAPEHLVETGPARAWPGFAARPAPVAGARLYAAARAPAGAIHPDLAVLLSTSGTTGSPKLVRLSHKNVQSNAESIARYLELDPAEVAITSLPISYSYGLSVVNSHLHAGAALACTNAGVVEKEFWGVMAARGCTSLAGVPVTYAMLERLHVEKMALPALRTLTQAGGALDADRTRRFLETARATGRRFFVMYGQTEATARIAYVPWPRLNEKLGSAGIAIPGGALSIAGGEVVYEGPNVMMGYAESRADLARGDELGGRLATGDLGRLDAEGFLTVTGRLKRFLKVFGLRINLDEVERMLETSLGAPVACVGRDDALRVVVESGDPRLARTAAERVAGLYGIHHSAITAETTTSLPVTDTGKKDYKSLERARVSDVAAAGDTAGALLAARAYGIPRAEKEALLAAELDRLTARHRAACEPYRRIVDAFRVPGADAGGLAPVPFLPARLFKTLVLRSVSEDEVVRVVTSSGTSGQAPSRIALDRETAMLQSRWLAAIMTAFLGPKRLPMILLDARSTVGAGGALTARGAGLVGLSSLGRDHLYALDDAMALDTAAVREFAERHAGETILLFGFTFMVWAYLVRALEARGERLPLDGAVLIHSGGWKKLADEAVDADRFQGALRERCGIARVHDFYGMAEQTGGVYVACEEGRLHAPNCSEVLIRDARRFTPLSAGETGLVQTLSILPRSYPGHSILTEDLGEITGVDDCPCGRLGTTLRIHGRVPKSELRGCSDTHAAGSQSRPSAPPRATGEPMTEFATDLAAPDRTVTVLAPGRRDGVPIAEVCPEAFFEADPLPAFDPASVAFLADLSAAILAIPGAARHPEIVAVAYWLRRANIESLISEFRRSIPARELVMPRGTAFHVAPANVDTIFLYSWALSTLAGNLNVVRVGGVMDESLALLLGAVRDTLAIPRHAALAERNRVVSYPRTDAVNRYLSERADVRVLWGGDATVRTLRALPTRPAAKEIAFADRFSYAVASAESLLAINDMAIAETARLFVNDALAFDQLACSSPRLVYFEGPVLRCGFASARWWDRVAAEIARRVGEEEPAAAIEKLVFGMRQTATAPGAFFVRPPGSPSPVVVRVPAEGAAACRETCGGGFFFESFVADVAALGAAVEATDQTLTAIGFTADERLDLARALCLRGIDRVVPPGQALAFGPTWDGYALLSELTRRVTVS